MIRWFNKIYPSAVGVSAAVLSALGTLHIIKHTQILKDVQRKNARLDKEIEDAENKNVHIRQEVHNDIMIMKKLIPYLKHQGYNPKVIDDDLSNLYLQENNLLGDHKISDECN